MSALGLKEAGANPQDARRERHVELPLNIKTAWKTRFSDTVDGPAQKLPGPTQGEIAWQYWDVSLLLKRSGDYLLRVKKHQLRVGEKVSPG